jgi:hypothetical protein
MTVTDAIKLRGWCIHETSHPMYQPDGFDILKNNPMKKDSKLGFIFNMVMDVHCETMRALQWPGDAKALSEYGAVLGHELIRGITETLKEHGDDEDYLKSLAILVACVKSESAWNVGMALSFDKLYNDVLPKDTVSLGESIMVKFRLKERLVENAPEETSQKMFDLSKEIYKFLYDEDPEKEVNPPEKGKKATKGEPGNKGLEEEAEGQSDAEDTTYDPNAKDGDGKLKQKPKVSSILWSDHYETLVGKGHGMGFDFTQYKESGAYVPVDFAKFTFVDYRKGGSVHG